MPRNWDKAKLTEEVIAIIVDYLQVPFESITVETKFEELNIDSLDVVELTMEIEEKLRVDLEPEALQEKHTVGALISYLDQL